MSDHLPQAPEVVSRASKEIMALHTGAELKPVIPTTLEEAFRFAQLVCQAGLAPKSYEMDDGSKRPDPQKVVVGILTALELGVPPLQGLSGIAIINGRPSVWGDLAVGLVHSRGLVQNQDVTETGTFPNDDYTVTVKFWRRGQTMPYEGKFSVADAKRARLWANPKKQPWIDYPKRMVFNRARAFPLRDGFSDALKGLSLAEEMLDITAEAAKPVDAAAFLSDDSAPAEAVQAETAPHNCGSASAEPGPHEASEASESEPMQRGRRLLASLGNEPDIADLRASISDELGEPELSAWQLACGERLTEIEKAE